MPVTSKLHAKSIRMASDLQSEGVFGHCPHDLLTFGSAGASIAAARGRYVWIVSADHPTAVESLPLTGVYNGGADFIIGYSNDPGCPPEFWATMVPEQFHAADARTPPGVYKVYHFNDFFYNPDDATYPFYLFVEGVYISGGPTPHSDHEGALLRSNDLVTWVSSGAIFIDSGVAGGLGNGFTGFERAKRLTSSSWEAIGRGYLNLGTGKVINCRWVATAAAGPWTTNGVGLTRELTSPARTFWEPFGGPLSFNIGGQNYMLMTEDARIAGVGGTGEGQYTTLVACDSGYNVLASPAPQRLSQRYDGYFPGLTFHQSTSAYIESGILHFWVQLGYCADGVNPSNGQHENAIDYYSAVIDATAAANAAPVGVRVECDKGLVVVSWYDALPHQNYRVYKSTDGGSSYDSGTDVTGCSYTNAAAANATYYYKVVTRNAGADQGQRIVKTYVSNARRLANQHVTRATAAGATNINVAYVDRIVTLLRDMDLTDRLMHWTDPRMGVVKDGSNITSVVYCLGTTLVPFGGDWRAKTGSTASVYAANGFATGTHAINGTTSAAHGYFNNGRYNPFRRKVKLTLGAVYKKSHTNLVCFFGTTEFGGIQLTHETGSPGAVKFRMYWNQDTSCSTAASAATGAHVAIATFDGVTQTVYVDGVTDLPGGTTTGQLDNVLLDGPLRGGGDVNQCFLGTGSTDVKFIENTDALPSGNYVFNNSQANFDWATLFVFDADLSPTQVKILNAFLTADRAGATYTLPAYDPPFVKDIKADYGALGTGTPAGGGADDSNAFITWSAEVQTWLLTHTGLVVLKIPAGSYRCATNLGPFKNIPELLVLGADRDTVSILDNHANGNGLFFGNADVGYGHVNFNVSNRALINTVAAGSPTIKCVTASDRFFFTAGKRIFVGGLDVEGDGGQPPALGYYEWPKITSIDTDGTLHLEWPLENSYKSTWPTFAGTPVGVYGGPATAWPIDNGWEGEHEYRDITIAAVQHQTKAPKQFIRFKHCASVGPGIYPTEAQVYEFDDVNWNNPGSVEFSLTPGVMEIDKLVGTFRIKGGVLVGIESQTPVQKIEISRGARFGGSEFTAESAGQVIVGARKVLIDGIHVDGQASFAPKSFGSGEDVVAMQSMFTLVDGGSIANIGANSQFDQNLSTDGWTMSGGTLQIAKSALGTSPQWATPGHMILFRTNPKVAGALTVADISQSGSNILVTTNRSAGFPPVSGFSGIQTHPAERFTMRNCCDPVYNGFGAYNDCQGWSSARPFKPMYSHVVKSYTGYYALNHSANIHMPLPFLVFGGMGTITIAVSTAYTGVTNPLLWRLFGGATNYYKTDGTTGTWDPVVDLRRAGTRVISLSGVTGAGGLDALTPPAGPIWLSDTMQPALAASIPEDINSSAVVGPVVTVTYALDQTSFAFDAAAAINLRTVVSWAGLSGTTAVVSNRRTVVSWAALSGSNVVAGASGTGALVSTVADLDGVAVSRWTGSGALAAQVADLDGVAVAVSPSTGTGALAAARASLAGFPGAVSTGAGALAAQRSVLAAAGDSASAGSGTLVARPATIFSTQAVISAPSEGRIIVVHASSRVIEAEADNLLMAA